MTPHTVARAGLLSLLASALSCASPPPAEPLPPPRAPVARAATVAAAPSPAPELAAPALDDATRATLAAQLEALATLGTGASLAVAVDGQIVPFVTGTLLADGPPVAPSSRFGVASVSKLFTAAKIIRLAHAGELALTDPVGEHLSGVRFVDEGGDNLADRITLEQLLMHRGGLPHFDPAFDPKAFGSSWQDPELLTKMGRGWTLKLAKEPGHYGYSNLGYATLAAVIEATESCSFADCMAPFLADELGLKSATMWPPSLKIDVAHGRQDKGGEVSFLAPAWYGSRLAVPYSGLFVSMPDLARFGTMLIEARESPEATLHAMTTGIPAGEKGHGRGPVHSVRGTFATMRHDGSGPGFLAYLIAVPDRSLAVAVAVNGGGDTKEGGKKLRTITDAMLAALLES